MRNFECQECYAKFVRKHDLKRHIRSIHSNSKPHQCPNCSLSFARADGLKRHLESEIRQHTSPTFSTKSQPSILSSQISEKITLDNSFKMDVLS